MINGYKMLSENAIWRAQMFLPWFTKAHHDIKLSGCNGVRAPDTFSLPEFQEGIDVLL